MSVTLTRPETPTPTRRPVFYPTGDGKPMAETDLHVQTILNMIAALQLHFQDRAEDVYVAGNNFLFWSEGEPRRRVSPDTYVVFGVRQRPRDSYKSWEEGGRLPAFVLEVTSRRTRSEDNEDKFDLYERVLRIPEYFRYDPTGDYLRPQLQGLELVGDRYSPLPMEEGQRVLSKQLNLYLTVRGDGLRLQRPATDELIPTLKEAEAARRQAEAERQRAETEIERLRAELEALRRGGQE
jgi:Uma2 family endonuclease